MKKKTAVIAVIILIIAALLISVFLVKRSSKKKLEEALSIATQAVIISPDKSVFPDFIYNSDAITTDSLAGEKSLSIEDREPLELDELAEKSPVIIRADINSLSYTFINGIAWTQADVLISEVLKGELQPGNIVSVYYPGGYASAEDYNDFYSISSSDTNKYYKCTADSYPVPQSGQDNIFFLSQSGGSLKIPAGAYTFSMGSQSVMSFDAEKEKFAAGERLLSYEDILSSVK